MVGISLIAALESQIRGNFAPQVTVTGCKKVTHDSRLQDLESTTNRRRSTERVNDCEWIRSMRHGGHYAPNTWEVPIVNSRNLPWHVPSNIWTGWDTNAPSKNMRSTNCKLQRLFMTFWYMFIELLIVFLCKVGLLPVCTDIGTDCLCLMKTNSIVELILTIDFLTFFFT